MVLFPGAQRQAHMELDAVVGHDRLPEPDDFDSLPYIRQIMKESLRCRPHFSTDVLHD